MHLQGQKLKLIGFLLLVMGLVSPVQGQLTIFENDSYKVKTASGKHKSTQISFGGLKSFSIEYRGRIDVNETDTEVTAIEPGGYLEISKTTFGSKRSIIIEPSEGKLRKEYYEGRKKVDYDPEGRKWMAEILPEIVRTTGIAAESRIERYFKKGGVDAVMNEVSRLDGSYVKSIYGRLLLKKEGLSNQQLTNSLKSLTREIDSDYYKAEILTDIGDRFLKNEQLSQAYFEATLNIKSDYYSASVLSKGLKGRSASDELISKIIEACNDIESDYYHAQVLEDALKLRNINDFVISEVVKSTGEINSDYYQAQVLSRAIETPGISGKSFNNIIEAIGNVNSDYYMAEVFEDMVKNRLEEDVIVQVIEIMDRDMSSDYYKSSVFSDIVSDQEMTTRSMKAMSQAISRMSSASYASEVIEKAAKAYRIEKQVLIELLNACAEINSDYYKSESLVALAEHVREADEDVKAAYRKAADEIGSTHYYGVTMKALSR